MDSDVGNAAPSKSTNINYFCACIFILSTSLFMSYIVYTNMCISETKYEIYKCLLGIVWAIFCAVASKFYIKFIFSTLNSKFNKPLFFTATSEFALILYPKDSALICAIWYGLSFWFLQRVLSNYEEMLSSREIMCILYVILQMVTHGLIHVTRVYHASYGVSE